MSQVVSMADAAVLVPVVDQRRIKGVHEEIQGMPEIHLDADPLAAGPKAMNNKKAAVRNQLSRCTQIELQVLEDRGWFQRELTREEAKYNIAFTNLITHDPHIRSGRSASDREAAAKVRLAEEVERIDWLRLAVEDLERLHEVLKAKKKDLGNLQTQLRDQLKICEHELGLGSRWGQASPTGAPYSPVVSEAADAFVVDDLLERVDSQGRLDAEVSMVAEAYENEEGSSALEVEEIEETLPSTASTEEVDEALLNLEVETEAEEVQDPSEVDVDDILNDLEYDD